MQRFSAFLALLASAAAQRGSPLRCRDKEPACPMWYARGECEGNYQYMSENCPRACGYCENAGLMPTPATFQLDFVCKGQLAKLPSNAKASHYTPEALPEACSFRCRDNMTAPCAKASSSGMCDTHADVMRFQCPESCGVCKGLELGAGDAYPKHACAHEAGDDPAHAAQCGRWAEEGECVKNFGFMGKSCELSCGLCALDGAVPESSATILALKPAAAAKASGGKKKPKKKGDEKPKAEAPKAEKAKAEKAKAEKKPKAEKPAKADTADKPKGKGFWGGLKDAFGGGKKKEAKPKDEA